MFVVFFLYMQITTRYWAAAGIGFVIAVGTVWFVYEQKTAAVVPPVDTTTSVASTTDTATSQPATATSTKPFSINSADAISSWNFKGAYTGNDTLIKQANADIAHLTSLLGKGQYDDYDLYNGIANDYDLLGDGTTAYRYYNLAIAVHPTKGLVYANLAHLMDQLGATRTAVDAYAKAVAVEPGMLEYHIERLNYLTQKFPKENALIVAALTDVSKQFGDTPAILSIEAKWLTGLGRYTDAIKAWETVKMLSPENRQAAIDAEIARLKAKQ